MSGLLFAGFDYADTDHLPSIWDSAAGVTLAANAGRLADLGMLAGAAYFDGQLDPHLTKALTWTGTVDEQAYTFCGLAIKPVFIGSDAITIAQLTTSASTFSLKVTRDGAVTVEQNGVELVSSSPGVVVPGFGIYLEWQVSLIHPDNPTGVIIRSHGMTTLASGLLDSLAHAEVFQSFTLGGGSGEVGQWYIDDLYVCDGHPENPLSFTSPIPGVGTRLIDNAGFLGNVVVQGLLATNEGHNIGTDPGYTSWTPSSGLVHYNRINDQPPNDGDTEEHTVDLGTPSGHHLDIYATYLFKHPLTDQYGYGTEKFGIQPGTLLPYPIFALQFITSLSTDAARTAKVTMRSVFGDPSTDRVDLGRLLALSGVSYFPYRTIKDRDPSL